ncbi:polyprenol monophosphomannose synthase [bacterium]|nr:polyprenol monophosphomannose synthase [bacterium]
MKSIVVLPTYNEAKNIGELITKILEIHESLNVLVVDDNSPDGTWKIVEEMEKSNPRVKLFLRTAERGRGTAGIAGFIKALEDGGDNIIEMDADFSHNPAYLEEMLSLINEYDVVIGSRFEPGGGERGRHPARKYITQLANLYIRIILGIKVKDATSGYRCFKRHVMQSINLEKMNAKGPEVVQEVLYAVTKKGYKIKEIPIIFEERKAGESTFNVKIMLRSLVKVPLMRLRKIK